MVATTWSHGSPLPLHTHLELSLCLGLHPYTIVLEPKLWHTATRLFQHTQKKWLVFSWLPFSWCIVCRHFVFYFVPTRYIAFKSCQGILNWSFSPTIETILSRPKFHSISVRNTSYKVGPNQIYMELFHPCKYGYFTQLPIYFRPFDMGPHVTPCIFLIGSEALSTPALNMDCEFEVLMNELTWGLTSWPCLCSGCMRDEKLISSILKRDQDSKEKAWKGPSKPSFWRGCGC